MTKKKGVFIAACLIVLGFLYFLENYTASTSFYGTVEIKELEISDYTYIVTVEGDFGTKVAKFTENDHFDIVEDEEFSDGDITEIWKDLSEDESFFVLLKAYTNRDKFTLQRIYIE